MIRLANGAGSSVLRYSTTLTIANLPRNYSYQVATVNHNLGVIPNMVQVQSAVDGTVYPLADDFWGGDGGCYGFNPAPVTTTQATFTFWYMSNATSVVVTLAYL